MDLGCLGPAGFRGWSGGARRSFVITPEAATPGYLPGELEPGTWQVVIGLHRVPPEGADYRVTTEVSAPPGELSPRPPPERSPPLTERPPRRDLPATPGRRWLAGDLHTHTVHSDGVMTVPELARFAAEPRPGLPRGHRSQHDQPSRASWPRPRRRTASCWCPARR